MASGGLVSKSQALTSSQTCLMLKRTRIRLCKLMFLLKKNSLYEMACCEFKNVSGIMQEAGSSECESGGKVAGGVRGVLESTGLRGAGSGGALEGLGKHHCGPDF